MVIYQNNIIELLDLDLKTDKIIRVLWISPNQEEIYVVEINDHKKMTFPFAINYKELLSDLEDDRARIVKEDPDLRLISPDPAYLEKYKKDRDTNWNIIKDIVCLEPEIYISEFRGALVEETKEKSGKAKKEIYKFLKKYWFYGKTKNALLKNYFDCGRSSKPREYTKNPGPKPKDGIGWILTEKDKEIFRKAIKEFHIKEKMDLTATHQHMCEESYHSGFYRKHGVMVPMVDPQNAPIYNWKWIKFRDVCALLTCGYASTPTYVSANEGMPFISAKNVKPYKFMPEEHNYITKELYGKLTKTCNPQKGDILLTRVGAGIGEATIIDRDLPFAIYVSLTLIKLVNYELLDNKYILYWLNSPIGVMSSIKNIFGKGASQGNLNVNNVRNFLLPLPPLEEQKRIVAKIEELLPYTKQLVKE